METPIKIECPICMDDILDNNKVVTECGHTFHCSCLMRNVSHNGFGCPYCRSIMAEEVIEEDEDEDNEYENFRIEYESDDEDELYSNNALTSFRMFNQMIEGEEVEEDPNEDEDLDEDENETVTDEDTVEDINNRPHILFRYVSNYVRTLGISYDNLVAHIMDNNVHRNINHRNSNMNTTAIINDAMIRYMNIFYGNDTTNIHNIANVLEEYLNPRRTTIVIEEPNTNTNTNINTNETNNNQDTQNQNQNTINDTIMLVYRDWWQSRYNVLPKIAETKGPIREIRDDDDECIYECKAPLTKRIFFSIQHI